MEDKPSLGCHHNDSSASPPAHRRAPSGSSLLSRLPFLRHPVDIRSEQEPDDYDPIPVPSPAPGVNVQAHRSRRRRGSLRKVALLGRGSQRETRDDRSIADARPSAELESEAVAFGNTLMGEHDALGLKLAGLHRTSSEEPPLGPDTKDRLSLLFSSSASVTAATHTERDGERTTLYGSTTDEEDMLQMPSASPPPRASLSLSSGSESYLANREVTNRQRSFQQAKSPLSYSGISTSAIQSPDIECDYTETEWWGWVVLTVTWFVFVMGMGSCLDVWSWAWDVGKTPYAPPELEDDPTLPIVGYYPALIIMTGVMAWVWVVVAWVGMKYFRHAKISGD
ncbi:hypothetical protein HIM_04980 [Hirsutella minnesotensis 3608]|uniref:Uncharacterized protein n=1 Tax=Hirsutella minnesotensis 3608 TaxID=1043627 RepID=A0A0F8A0P9_9HYPO|nr:hypothetical protein HIM_04980 [Hirsutella minnesotensis 3608]